MEEFFKLFACCIPVKGASLSIIYDLQRVRFQYIPNQLFYILEKEIINLKELFKEYSQSEKNELQEYFSFLIEEEYGMLTDSPESFPKIDTTFITPELINNAIVDYSSDSKHDFAQILADLEGLGCKHLELRFYDIYPLQYIFKNVISNFKDTSLRNVMLYIKYSNEISNELLYNEIIMNYPVITDIVIHSAPFNKRSEERKLQSILYLTEEIDSEKHCGIIGIEYFSIKYSTYFESLKFNSCLNKKIAIDSNGFIKNCPSMNNNYGNIRDVSLGKAITDKNFKNLWHINKDKISICKDCQFRYICTDCRAYLEEPNNELSKPLKCGYNPYTNVWEEWTTNPLKKEAINSYGMMGLK